MPFSDQWFLILNPTAGSGRAGREWNKIRDLFQARGLAFEAVQTTGPGDATRLTIEAIEKGFRRFIAIGGDGTNNEVINGIMLQQQVPSHEITYALLPIGTGNDWVKTHSIPARLEDWTVMLEKGNTCLQNVGKASYHLAGKEQTRYFINVAGMGYDAYVARIAESQKGKVSNKLFYFYLIFKCLADYSLKNARVIFDDREIVDQFYTIHAGICKYSGGGMRFVPHAQPDGDHFALTLIRNVSKMGVVRNTYRLYDGSIGKMKQADIYHAQKIRVEAIGAEPTLVEVDGEFLGETPVEFVLVKNAVRVVVP